MLSTGSAREKLQERDSLGMLQTLLGLGTEASRARSSLSSASLTSYPHPVPANAEQQNKEIRQAHLPVFSQKKTRSVRGGRKDGTSLEVLLSHMGQG